MKLAIVCIVRDEDRYLHEWIAHYLALGVDSFLFYNNESNDETSRILDECAQCLPLTHIPWQVPEGTSPQLSAYNDAIDRLRNADFAAFFDIDEFLVLKKGTPGLKQLITRLFATSKEYGAIVINQRLFGSSYLESAGNDPVLTRFPLCSESNHYENKWVKSIYRINSVLRITGIHSCPVSGGLHLHPSGLQAQFEINQYSGAEAFGQTLEIDHSCLQLNHYMTKSLEEFRKKQLKGGAAQSTRRERLSRFSEDYFHSRLSYANTTIDHDSIRLSKGSRSRTEWLAKYISNSIKKPSGATFGEPMQP